MNIGELQINNIVLTRDKNWTPRNAFCEPPCINVGRIVHRSPVARNEFAAVYTRISVFRIEYSFLNKIFMCILLLLTYVEFFTLQSPFSEN